MRSPDFFVILFSCGENRFFCGEVFHNPEKVVASWVTPASLEGAYLVRRRRHSSFLICSQLAERLEPCQAQKRHTDPKKASSLNSSFLDPFAKCRLGCGRNLFGGKSQVRTLPMCHLLLRCCLCTCFSGMVPVTAPCALLWAVLPAGPVLTCSFACTLQMG